MIHPHTELKFISPEIGFGVVATQLIPKGTITWVSDPLDHVFTPNEIRNMPALFKEKIRTYCYRDQNGNFVLCWDHGRFVNHSFNSSCVSTAYNFEMAVRDIHPGEELTDDYGYLNITESFECLQEPGCDRTHVMPDDLLRHYRMWDNKLRDAFKEFNKVAQPFLPHVDPKHIEKVLAIAEGKAHMDSILNCYHHGSGENVFDAHHDS